MALLSETFAHHKGRIRTLLEEDPVTSEEVAFQANYDRVMTMASEYITWDPKFLSKCNSHVDKIDLWYVRRWRVSNPNSPPCLWDATSSVELAMILGGYLLWLCTKVTPHNGSSKIRSSTLRGWAVCIMYLTGFNVLSIKLAGRHHSIVYGTLGDRSDSLWNLISKTLIPILIRDLGLPHHSPPKQFWGPDELMLICRALDLRMLSSPLSRRVGLLSFKATNQFLLATSNQTGIVAFTSFKHSGTEFKFTEENKLVIYQVTCHCYEIEVDLEYLKGYSREDHDNIKYKPWIPPITKAGNMQPEFAYSIIPLLIHRRALYTCRQGIKVIFTNMDSFLATNDATLGIHGNKVVEVIHHSLECCAPDHVIAYC